jgi:hypothetical protein
MNMNGGEAASSPYDTFAPKYIERGHLPLPIEPGKKWPAFWNGQNYTLLAGWTTKPPITTPQPGAGIGLRLGVASGLDYVLVGLDLDDEEVAIRLLGIAPDTPVRKVGQRGETWIYKARPDAIATKRYRLGDKTIAELLAAGTQTVLPPSRHPAGMAYRWLGKSLLDVNIDELPELTPDTVAKIETALRSVGWEPEPEKPAPPPEDIDADDPFERAKTLAMRNLPAWVPYLGLERYRRRRGPHASYEAVPSWRPSSTGRSIGQRGYNLKISPKGICDYGDGEKGYSAIDLVMAARRCTVSQALDWLEERLALNVGTEGLEIDFDALIGASEPGPKPNPEPNPGGGLDETDGDGSRADQQRQSSKSDSANGVPNEDADEKILKEAGAWFHGDTAPPVPECSFERFLPVKGAGSLVAQFGCNKTHIMVDLGVAFSCDGLDVMFAGRKRLRRGGVVLIEFEESEIPLRVACAAKHRGVPAGALPLMSFPTAPPMLLKKKLNPAAVKWYRTILGAAQRRFERKFGLPLAMVGVDPLIDAGGIENENDSIECNEAMKAFDAIGQEFGCLVMVNDHAGKDVERGARGSSAKPGKSHFQLTLPEKVGDPSEHRKMKIKKLRNLPDGWSVDLWFEEVEVETADGVLASNLAACWGEITRGGEETTRSQVGRPPKLQRMALRVLSELVVGNTPSSEVPWISLETWYEALIEQTVIEPDDPHRRFVFKRIKDALWEKGEIKIRGDKVCIPLQT